MSIRLPRIGSDRLVQGVINIGSDISVPTRRGPHNSNTPRRLRTYDEIIVRKRRAHGSEARNMAEQMSINAYWNAKKKIAFRVPITYYQNRNTRPLSYYLSDTKIITSHLFILYKRQLVDTFKFHFSQLLK